MGIKKIRVMPFVAVFMRVFALGVLGNAVLLCGGVNGFPSITSILTA